MKNIYIGEVEENASGEMVLNLPFDLISQMGWTEETLLEWEVAEDDKVLLKEVENGSNDNT